jgi:predicted LPLAT superfamily acyltransferase
VASLSFRERVVRPVFSVPKVPRSDRDKAAVELARARVRGLEPACLPHLYLWFNFHDTWEQA